MSFAWFAATPLRTREQVAAEVHVVSLARGLDQFATVLTCMAIDIEVGAADAHGNPQWWCPANPAASDSTNFPHDSLSNDSRSCGYLQQQSGPQGQPWWGTTENEMTLSQAANTFQDRLADDYGKAINDPHAAGQLIQAVQGSDFPDRYQAAWNIAWDVVNRALSTAATPVAPTAPVTAPVVGATSPTSRPDFNEYALWSPNHEPRNGTTVDLWLWHTEEGHFGDPDAADDLARGDLDNPASQVSYHRTASQAPDGGVTVCDVVDISQASWSVLSANSRSIDFCIAGSTVNWTRDEWFANAGKVIDVGCYLSVLDHLKVPTLLVNGAPRIIAPDPNNTTLYHCAPPGISDHKYVTQYLHDGTHSDVGPNFPWDYVEARTAYWFAVVTGAPTPAPTTGGTTVTGNPYQTDVRTDGGHYSALAYSQLAGPLDANGQPAGWPQFDGLSLVDFLAQMDKKIDGIAAAHTTAAVKAAVRAGGVSGTETPAAAKRQGASK